ncbi:hypothetical protein P9112_006635 [Eukaryota sp. TZLM1-RC]
MHQSLSITVDVLSASPSELSQVYPSYCSHNSPCFLKKCLEQYYTSIGHPLKLPSVRPLKLSSRLDEFDSILASEDPVFTRFPVANSLQILFSNGTLSTIQLSSNSISHIQIDHIITPSLNLSISSAFFSPSSSHIFLAYEAKSFIHVLSSSNPSFTLDLPSPALSVDYVSDLVFVTLSSSIRIYSNTDNGKVNTWNLLYEFSIQGIVCSKVCELNEELLLIVFTTNTLLSFSVIGDELSRLHPPIKMIDCRLSCNPMIISNTLVYATEGQKGPMLTCFNLTSGDSYATSLESPCSSLDGLFGGLIFVVGLCNGKLSFFDSCLHIIEINVDVCSSASNCLPFPDEQKSSSFPLLISHSNDNSLVNVVLNSGFVVLLGIIDHNAFVFNYFQKLLLNAQFDHILGLVSTLQHSEASTIINHIIYYVYPFIISIVEQSSWSELFNFIDSLTDSLSKHRIRYFDLLNTIICIREQIETLQLSLGVSNGD